MAAKEDKEKDKDEPVPSLFSRVSNAIKRLPGASLLFAIGPLTILGYLGWFYYGAEHIDRALYSLRLENLSVTAPTPEWLKTDVVKEVFNNSGLERISLLDPSATATIAQAFKTHNWVKSVSSARKLAGGKVSVDLIYRKPIALVFYHGKYEEEGVVKELKGFYPVDAEGIVLPDADFFPDAGAIANPTLDNYIQIFAEDARPANNIIGMAFGDPRITEAISLCQLLEPVRSELGITEIEIVEDRSAGPSPYIHLVATRDRKFLVWGHAPSVRTSNEPSPEEKMERMVTWLKNGRLSASSERLDLRNANNSYRPVSGISNR